MFRTALSLALSLGLSASPATYDEPYRPQYHFSLPQSWMGDPNGLVYENGRYHLYSYGTWEGATSTDLVHWQNEPVTGPQRDAGSNAFFSGSAVVDTHNTTGFGTLQNPPMVAMYTSVQQGSGVQAQSLAYSTDHGRSWTRYDGNPVIDLGSKDFRDPKVFWYEPTHDWRMVITLSDQHKVSIYSSPDLKQWKHLSDFGPAGSVSGVWEMPDLFPLRVDGNPRNVRWVMSVSVGSTGVQYFVGGFDGTTYTPDGPATYTPPPGVPLENFESGSYGDWTTIGDAFGAAPATGALPDQQNVSGFVGTRLVNSFNGGDRSTGSLSSPTFTITKPHLNFAIGGGQHPYVEGAAPFGTLPAGDVFADFSGPTYGEGWTATGSFANSGPSPSSLPNQLGAQVLDTFTPDGDAGTGTITSPVFTVDHPYIDLQVAGGDHPWGQPNPTAVNLLVDGKVVATATGPNAPDLTWNNWDVSRFQGKQAQIQVVDDNTGAAGWGHLMVGDILFADGPAKPWDVETGVNLVVDGKVVRSATGANSEAMDWTSWDLQDLIGKQAHLEVVDHSSGGWGHVLADDFRLSDAPALSTNERAHWLDFGSDFYAANTWNGTGGKRVGIAWMNNWAYAGQIPTSPWKGATTFPRDLSLRTVDGSVQLVQQPVPGLTSLRGQAVQLKNVTATNGVKPVSVDGDTLEIEAQLHAGTASRFGLNVRIGATQYTQIGYDTRTKNLYVERTHSGTTGFSSSFADVKTAPLELDNGQLTLRILVDRSSVEVFADQGQVTLADQIFPDPTSRGVSLFADNGTTSANLKAWPLKSAWH
ncbi:MAG TPA: GH32 C-terminal domain-containing protein [Kribbella sp.]